LYGQRLAKKETEEMLKIIGHNLCPYVQRVVILMNEKNVPFERIDIDLDNKPDWLAQYSPTGTVPLLLLPDGRSLFESQVISDYVDEISMGSLQPTESFEKARHRAWGEFGTAMLNIIAKIIYQDTNEASFDHSVADLKRRLGILENQLKGGLYFTSDDFYFIDGIYATVFRYFETIQLVTSVRFLEDYTKLTVWYVNLQQRPSVIAAVPKEYRALLLEFISKKNSYLARTLDQIEPEYSV